MTVTEPCAGPASWPGLHPGVPEEPPGQDGSPATPGPEGPASCPHWVVRWGLPLSWTLTRGTSHLHKGTDYGDQQGPAFTWTCHKTLTPKVLLMNWGPGMGTPF